MEEDLSFETEMVQDSLDENNNLPNDSRTHILHLGTTRHFSFDQSLLLDVLSRDRMDTLSFGTRSRRSTPLIASSNPSRRHSEVTPSTSTPVLSLYARDTENERIKPAEMLPSMSSHSILFLREPSAFGEQDSQDALNILNSDLNVRQENRNEETSTLTEVKVVRGRHQSMNDFLQQFSPSLPVDGIWRHSTLHTDAKTQMRIARRRVTASMPVEIVDHFCWLAPRLPAYCHVRHSYAGVNDSDPWIYEAHERTELETFLTHSPSEISLISGDDDDSAFGSRANVDIEDEVEDRPYEEFILQPIPSLALDYVNPETVSPEHPFPAPSGGRTPAFHAVMAYINQPEVLLTQEVNEDNVPLLNSILSSTTSTTSPSICPLSSTGRRLEFITSNSLNTNERAEFSMARLRLELYHNVNLRRMVPPPVNNFLDYFELATDASDENVRSQSNVLLLSSDSDVTEGVLSTSSSGSRGSSIIESTGSNSSTLIDAGYNDRNELEDIRRGNTDPLQTSSSSHMSLGSGIDGTNLPVDWLLPSTTTIGRKYDFLRVTDRPRAFAGHKFVISMFGAIARQEESRLPWIPTYAERLQMVLNQYLQQSATLRITQSTQTEEPFHKSELILIKDQNTKTNDKEKKFSNPKMNNGFQCSSKNVVNSYLKHPSRDAVKVNKVFLRASATQKNCEDDINSNFLTTSLPHTFDNSRMLQTQSCPEITLNVQEIIEKPSTNVDVDSYRTALIITSFVESHSEITREDISPQRKYGMKRKRKKKNLFFRICSCQGNNSDTDFGIDKKERKL